MAEEAPYAIELLDISLDIIEEIQRAGQVVRPSALAAQLGLNRTRVFRILKNLERRGYVEYSSHLQGYRLGLRFLALGEAVKENIDLRREAESILMELARTTGDAANLLVLYGDSAVCVEHYRGEHLLQVAAPIGQPLPLYIGATPKILLAHLPEAEQERILSNLELVPYTEKTITSREALRQQLELIRQQGYSVDEGDFERGVYAIGAPVRDHCGQVIAGITITVPATRYNPQRRQELIGLVVSAARQLSQCLGYRPEDRS